MIDFRDKTYDKILKEQLARVPDTIDKREGSIIQTALGPECWYLEGLYLDMAQMQKNVYVETAGGESLDRIAAGYGLARKPATRPVKKGVFDAEVQIGARMSAVVGEVYLVYRAIAFINVSDGIYAYAMECELAGEAGNGYSGQMIPIDYIPGLTKADLTSIIAYGSEEETDDALRNRVLQKIRKPSTSGNKYDYYNWAMECAGVGSAKVFPLASGPGTVKVVVADSEMTAASAVLLQTVREHIEELRPIGANVTVTSVVERAVNVSADIKLQAGQSLNAVQNEFQEALTRYLHEEALDMSYVSLAKVGNLLLGIDGVEDYTGLLLNGAAGNVALLEDEIAVTGTVTLEVV